MPTLEFMVSVDTASGVASLKEFDKAVGDTGKNAKGSSEQFKIAGLSLTDLNSATALAKQGLEALKQVWEFGKAGAENRRVADSFEDTAASVGVSAEAMAAALDKAAKGTVDDEIFMATATKNMAFGVATSINENVALMELARAASIKFGGDTETAFAGISEAIGTLQTRRLKEFGIIVDAKRINDDYAATLGKTADALTEAEQREALRNEVLRQSKQVLGDAGNAALTSAEKFKKFETQIGNAVDGLKEFAVDAITPVLDRGEAMQTMMDDSSSSADRLTAAYQLQHDFLAGPMRGVAEQMIPILQAQIDKEWELFDAQVKRRGSMHDLITTVQTDIGAAIRMAAAQKVSADSVSQGIDNLARNYRLMGEAAEASNRRALEAMGRLTESMSGELRDETQRYAEQQGSLRDRASEIAAELDKLNASQGRAITVQRESSLTAAELNLVTQQLARAQGDLAVATDPLKQAELAVKVEDLQGKINGASGAVTTYIDNSRRISELQGQYDAVNSEIEANAKAHETATHRILFGYAQQELAVGGLTEKEVAALDRLAVTWGLKSQEDIEAMQNIRAAAADLAADGSIEKFLDRVVVGMPPARIEFEQQAAAMQHMHDVAKPLSTQTNTADFANQAVTDLSPAKQAFDDQAKAIQALYDETLPLATQTNTKSFSTAVVQDMAPAKEAIDNAIKSAGDLKGAIALLESKTIVVKTIFQTQGQPTTGGSSTTSTGNTRAGGGLVNEGWWYLHDDEVVLNSEQRRGREAIPAGWLPGMTAVSNKTVNRAGDTIVINDAQAMAMLLQQRRLDGDQRLEQLLG